MIFLEKKNTVRPDEKAKRRGRLKKSFAVLLFSTVVCPVYRTSEVYSIVTKKTKQKKNEKPTCVFAPAPPAALTVL